MRVLIADDSSVIRHLLEVTLLKWGYQVEVARDGAEAWEALQQADPPSLAILDWVMPGLTGPEICRLVRKAGREPYVYILLLTSKGLKEDLFEGFSAGADDYVTKPFDQHELKARLRAGHRIVDLQTELLKTREELREQATHDMLTHCWNRPAILDIFGRELARSRREGKPVGVVLADLDHFKSINDTYGHVAGDAVLQESARCMQASIRPYDSLGRYGGEEFLIILPGCDEEATLHHADRMCTTLGGSPHAIGGRHVTVTVSLGCTAVLAANVHGIEHYVRVADAALYRAKHEGRNRVVFQPGCLLGAPELEGFASEAVVS